MSFTYLGSPYTHDDPAVRQQRFEAVCRCAARLMQEGRLIFCPIAHSHPIEVIGKFRENGKFWKRQDEPYLQACDSLIVLTLPGWMESEGLAHEIAVAMFRGIPIEYIDG